MEWIYITIAGLLEIVCVIGLKYSHGFTDFMPSMLTIGVTILSFFVFSKALCLIPVGTGYAIFTGLGTVGTIAVGAIFGGEAINLPKIFFVFLMIFGIIGLKIMSKDSQGQQKVK
jgi:quaternary ammonium compound-resistance protein SugE